MSEESQMENQQAERTQPATAGTRALGQKVARYLRASEILRHTQATVEEYSDGSYGVRLRVAGIRQPEICEMLSAEINARLLTCSKTVLHQSRQIFNQGIDEVLE